MTSGLTPLKRFVIRTTLVVGSTLATIVGAESLATIDMKPTPLLPSTLGEATIVPPTTLVTKAPIASPPTIVIIRHSPVSTTIPNIANTNTIAIQPPRPVTVAQPPPVVIVQSSGPSQGQSPSQAPSQPATKSSR